MQPEYNIHDYIRVLTFRSFCDIKQYNYEIYILLVNIFENPCKAVARQSISTLHYGVCEQS